VCLCECVCACEAACKIIGVCGASICVCVCACVCVCLCVCVRVKLRAKQLVSVAQAFESVCVRGQAQAEEVCVWWNVHVSMCVYVCVCAFRGA